MTLTQTESTAMMYQIPPEMAEATRLTRLGKVAEATALIRRFLSGEPPAKASPTIIEGELAPAGTEPDAGSKDAGTSHSHQVRPRTGLRDTIHTLAAMAK